MRTATSIVTAIMFLVICLGAQGQTESIAYGTVNIVLANANGAVLVTDSRLSNNGLKLGEAAKLFRLDSTTVCAIAGFYRDSGPSSHNSEEYPAGTTIPYLIKTYQAIKRDSESLDEKLDFLIRLFEFDMAFVATARGTASLAIQPPSPSEITLVGIEHGSISILGATLVPVIDHGFVSYSTVDKIRQDVPVKLVHRFAGFTDVARSLSDPDSLAKSKDPILEYFGTKLMEDGGASLTTKDMLQIAKRLSRLTSSKHPNEVGGYLQSAEFSEGKLTTFDALPVEDSTFNNSRFQFSYIHNNCLPGSKGRQLFASPKPPSIMLFDHGSIVNCSQSLDEMMFVGTKFENAHLTYAGSPRSYFAPDNELVNTDLTLLNGVSKDSVFVRNLKEMYPDLIIRTASP